MASSSLIESVSGNPMFTAGAGLVGIGTALAVLKQGGKQAFHLAQRHYLTTLEIPSHDKSYYWTLQWITQQASRKTQHLSVRTRFVQHDNGSISTQFRFVPGQGRHYFTWQGTMFQIERQREKGQAGFDLSSSLSSAGSSSSSGLMAPLESVTITAMTRNKGVLVRMLEEAKSLALQEEEGKTVIYTAWGQEWRQFGYPRKRRPLSSVVLDDGVSEFVVGDIREFLKNGNWYMDRGIPYRRGYLLHGPPGSGKSSFIQAVAGELEYNICVLNLAEKYLSDDRLNMLLSMVPQRSIILLEDIDAAFTNVREKKNDANGLTFSGFLNALDGVVSSEGRIIFMTTNHLERLDRALIRPGRVDVKMLLDNASSHQIHRMFLRFYEGQHDTAEQFVSVLQDHNVSTAQLQGHFVFYKQDPQAALDNASQLLINPKVDEHDLKIDYSTEQQKQQQKERLAI